MTPTLPDDAHHLLHSVKDASTLSAQVLFYDQAKHFLHYVHIVEPAVNLLRVGHRVIEKTYVEKVARRYGAFIEKPTTTHLKQWRSAEQSANVYRDFFVSLPFTLYRFRERQLTSSLDLLARSPELQADSVGRASLHVVRRRVMTAFYMPFLGRLSSDSDDADGMLEDFVTKVCQLMYRGELEREVVDYFLSRHIKLNGPEESIEVVRNFFEVVLIAVHYTLGSRPSTPAELQLRGAWRLLRSADPMSKTLTKSNREGALSELDYWLNYIRTKLPRSGINADDVFTFSETRRCFRLHLPCALGSSAADYANIGDRFLVTHPALTEALRAGSTQEIAQELSALQNSYEAAADTENAKQEADDASGTNSSSSFFWWQ